MKRLADLTGSSVPCAGQVPSLGFHISGNGVNRPSATQMFYDRPYKSVCKK
jgi:hypothetical protein